MENDIFLDFGSKIGFTNRHVMIKYRRELLSVTGGVCPNDEKLILQDEASGREPLAAEEASRSGQVAAR